MKLINPPTRSVFTLFALTAIIIAAGCSKSDETPDITDSPRIETPQPDPQPKPNIKPEVKSKPGVSIRATSALTAPEPIDQIAFLPNGVAQWLGQILMITDSGALYRTTAQGRSVNLVSKGPFSDITTLIRTGKPAIGLSLDADGQIGAFIEYTDDGDMKAIAVSQDRTVLKSFCETAEPASDEIWALDKNGNVQTLKASVINEGIVEITTKGSIKAPKNILSCALSSSENLWALDDKKLYERVEQKWKRRPLVTNRPDIAVLSWKDIPIPLAISSGEQTLIALNADKSVNITIEDGLSIDGTDIVTRLAGTDVSFGSAFSDGLITVTGADRSRLILISRDYAIQNIIAFEN